MTAMIWVKIMIDMPLPTPRSVSSSPSHMITAVPAVMMMTIVVIVKTDGLGIRLVWQPGISWPDRASAMMPVDWRIARPMVRYLVYWVILAWPVWPSWRSASSRGITTASSWRMMLAVMYGMMPRAKTVSFCSAPPLNRFTSWSTLLFLLVFRQVWMACS